MTKRTVVQEPDEVTAGRGYVFCDGDQFGVRFNQRDCTPRWNDEGPARAYLDALTRGTRKPEYDASFVRSMDAARRQIDEREDVGTTRLIEALRKIEQIAAPVHADSDAARALRECYVIAVGELAALAVEQGVAMEPARTAK